MLKGLTYIRKRMGLSMQDLADKMGVTRQAIDRWEKGKTKITEDRLEQLEKVLHIPRYKFYEELDNGDDFAIDYAKLEMESSEHKQDVKDLISISADEHNFFILEEILYEFLDLLEEKPSFEVDSLGASLKTLINMSRQEEKLIPIISDFIFLFQAALATKEYDTDFEDGLIEVEEDEEIKRLLVNQRKAKQKLFKDIQETVFIALKLKEKVKYDK